MEKIRDRSDLTTFQIHKGYLTKIDVLKAKLQLVRQDTKITKIDAVEDAIDFALGELDTLLKEKGE